MNASKSTQIGMMKQCAEHEIAGTVLIHRVLTAVFATMVIHSILIAENAMVSNFIKI